MYRSGMLLTQSFSSESSDVGRGNLFIKRRVEIRNGDSASDASSGEESDKDAEIYESDVKQRSTLNFDMWHIAKAMKHVRTGDQTVCVAMLLSIIDYNLSSNVAAVVANDGLELLVNLLEVNDIKCRIASLEVMKIITQNKCVVALLVYLGAVVTLCGLLDEAYNKQEIVLVCDVIANMCSKRRAARTARRKGVFSILVTFLDVDKELLIVPPESLNEEEKLTVSLAASAANALWKLAKYYKCKLATERAGITRILSDILLSGNYEISTPLLGVLSECSTLISFQIAIESEGLVGLLLQYVKAASAMGSEPPETLYQSLQALRNAAGANANVRHMIRFHEGLETLLALLALARRGDKAVVADALATLEKVAIDAANVQALDALGAVANFTAFLNDTDKRVSQNAAGVLAEMCKKTGCRQQVVALGAVPTLVFMMDPLSDKKTIINSTKVVAHCAKNDEGIEIIAACGGLYALWSLLKHHELEVRRCASWALVPVIMHMKDAGESIRSLTGSLVSLVNMLQDEDPELVPALCALASAVLFDGENLSVLTEQGILGILSNILEQEDTKECNKRFPRKDPKGTFRELASAIANCSVHADARKKLGLLGVIPRLANCLRTHDAALEQQAARALYGLSYDTLNCVTMHAAGVVPLLLCAAAQPNKETQEYAAACLKNIRTLLLTIDLRKCRPKKIRSSWRNCGVTSV